MLDVLWITPIPPDRNGGGGHVRQANLLLALSRHARVHLFSVQPVRDPDVRRAVASLTELGLPEPGGWTGSPWARRARDLWIATLGRQPSEVVAGRRARRALAAAVGDRRADVAVIEYALLAPLGPRLGGAGRRILTLHNVGSVMSRQQASVEPGRRQRWFYRRDGVKWDGWVRRTVARYDRVITVSEDDLRAIGSPAAATVVPNGVDLDRFGFTDLPAEGRLVFTGALYTLPNRDGIVWFCREILPLIRRRHPGVQLEIVGLRPGPDVTALGDLDGVTVVGDVDDVAPHLAAARLAVVPLRIGSGTRLKVLEALAAGRPVVGTTTGVEGLGAEPGRHLMIADQPAAFADAVSRLLEDSDLAGAMVAEGRKLVEERYSWAGIGQRFVETVLDTAGVAGPGGPVAG